MSRDGQLFMAAAPAAVAGSSRRAACAAARAARNRCFASSTEEIGLAAADVRSSAAPRHWLRYRLPARYVRRNVQPLCLGQKQRWFLLRLQRPEPALRFDITAAARIRPLALGRLLAADPRGDLFQARGLYAARCTNWAASAFPDGPPPYPSWWRAQAGRERSPTAATGTPEACKSSRCRSPARLVVRTYAPVRRWLMLRSCCCSPGWLCMWCSSWAATRPASTRMQAAAQREALQDQIGELEQYPARPARAAGGGRGSACRPKCASAPRSRAPSANCRRRSQPSSRSRVLSRPGGAARPAGRGDRYGVQQFHIVPLPGAQQFSLRFTLSRLQRPEEPISGTHRDHRRHARWRPASVDLAPLTGGKSELAVQFSLFHRRSTSRLRCRLISNPIA